MTPLLVATRDGAQAWTSERHDKCMVRANSYAAEGHPGHNGLTEEEIAERSAWLYAQCAQNDAAEAIAEEQGALAPELFPNTRSDRHAHPLHCMSLSKNRFGMHTEHNADNPPDDLEGPGGAAALNIPGEFMYAWIDGKARFLVRYVVWTVDDRDGNPLNPVRINNHPTYMGLPQTNVALVNFDEAFVPRSVWVEMPDTMAVANNLNSGVLPGRSLAVRTWMKSHCHDKRYPTVIPHVLIDRVQDLGWLDPQATEQEPRALRFESDGAPNQASSWSLVEDPVVLPTEIFTRHEYRWFYDDDVQYASKDYEPPTKPKGLKAAAKRATRIRIKWKASSDNHGVAGYKVFRNGVEVGFTSELFYKDDGLWPETEYSYKVHAVDGSGNTSHRSRIRAATTFADTNPPSKPKNLMGTAAPETIAVNWEPAIDDAAVSHYLVRVDGELAATTGDTSFLHTGLTPGVEYHYAVLAVDAFGNKGNKRHLRITTPLEEGTVEPVANDHTWRYLDDGSDAGTSWTQIGFDPSDWKKGSGEFGYGDGDENTVVDYGLSDDRHITTYFRAEFGFPDSNDVGEVQLRLVRDDGAVVYLNGVEVYRNNMPAGTLDAETLALSGISGQAESEWLMVTIPSDTIVTGENVLAVEIHQVHRTSSDISFNATLTIDP